MMLFGLPFFAFGVTFAIAGLLGKVTSSGGGTSPAHVVVPFGLIFGGVGALFMFGRLGLTLNRRDRTAAKWWGLLFPFKKTVHLIAEDAMILVTKEIRRSQKSSTTVFPVRIPTKDGELALTESRKYEQARQDAERAAKFMGLGMRDSSSGETIERAAGTLDESLRDRLKREGTQLEMPVRPSSCEIVESVEGDTAAFDLPRPKYLTIVAVFGGVAMLFGGIFFAAFLATMYKSTKGDPTGQLFFLVFLGITILAVSLTAGFPLLRMLTLRERVMVSTRGIKLLRRWALGRKTLGIDANELEELVVAQLDPIPFLGTRAPLIARSDRLSLEFGSGMDEQEGQWLCAVIRYLVTAPEKDG